MPRQAIDNATAINAEYSNRPLYGGTLYNAVPQPTPVRIATQNPVQELLERGLDDQNANAAEADAAIITRYESTLDLQHKSGTADIETALDSELANSRELSDGDPDSYFNADHTPRLDKIRDTITRYSAQASTLSRGYITPESKQRATAATTQVIDSIKRKISAEFGIQITKRARDAFARNYFSLCAAGKYDEAIASIETGMKNGGCTPEENTRYHSIALRINAKNKTKTLRDQGGDAAIDQFFNDLLKHGY